MSAGCPECGHDLPLASSGEDVPDCEWCALRAENKRLRTEIVRMRERLVQPYCTRWGAYLLSIGGPYSGVWQAHNKCPQDAHVWLLPRAALKEHER